VEDQSMKVAALLMALPEQRTMAIQQRLNLLKPMLHQHEEHWCSSLTKPQQFVLALLRLLLEIQQEAWMQVLQTGLQSSMD
jgi:hypothetical protein